MIAEERRPASIFVWLYDERLHQTLGRKFRKFGSAIATKPQGGFTLSWGVRTRQSD